jgi:hypothetical protein
MQPADEPKRADLRLGICEISRLIHDERPAGPRSRDAVERGLTAKGLRV